MRLLTFCKQLMLAAGIAALTCCFAVLSLQAATVPDILDTKDADKTITQLYHSLNRVSKSDMDARLAIISAQFLGKPYLLGALGEGEQSHYDQAPLYRVDGFDCETYVDTVLALALANNPNQFKHCINQVRYHNGQATFIQRNHFTCVDWNKNNQNQGLVKDITTTIRDKNNQIVVKLAIALIDKPAWYNHMSTNVIRVKNIDTAEQARRLQALKKEGKGLSRVISRIPYIPLSVLFDSSGKTNQYLLHQIPNAAIVEIIRPNWDLSKEIGTHLNVSHLGFVFWEKNILLFREASSIEHKVIDIPLVDYLRDAKKNPTIKGINIQIVLPQDNNVGLRPNIKLNSRYQ